MSREEGFAIADISTAKHTDPKFKALWRYLRDEQAMNAAAVIYEAVQLSSWQHGERITADDAAPSWIVDLDKPVEALVHVGLLDSDRLIPEHAWIAWFGPACDRRKALREKWARANRNRRGKGGPTQEPPRTPRGDIGGTAAPDRPSSPSDSQTVSPYPARPRGAKNGLTPIGETLVEFPPFGSRTAHG